MSRIEKAMERAAQMRRGEAVQTAETPRPQVLTSSRAAVDTPRYTPDVQQKVTSDSPLLVTLNDPYSATAEEYRKLKAVLVKMTYGDPFRNTMMVTSAIPGEGKSVTALNLAISLAQEYDHTVLLIDADLRRPTVHRYLNLERQTGLSDCLLEEAQLADAIIPTGIGRLSVITAGKEVGNPGELFSSHRMKSMLDEIKHRYSDRYIIFDAPPLLPFAETRSLAHLVDGVVFVIKEELATQTNIRDAVETLKGTSILGVVYNDASIAHNIDRYHSYRYHSYSADAV